MAGDRFTQIANAFFRDLRISYKAKGIFGLISTHRDGRGVTVAELARCGPEGSSAVRTGLKELERFGYLTRTGERLADGTLGDVTYSITDVPAHLYDLLGDNALSTDLTQHSRSQPESGFPTLAHPPVVDRPAKNTKNKKTKEQKTNSVRPAVRNACARERDAPHAERTGQRPEHQKAPARKDSVPSSPGERLLLAIGADHPEMLLMGQVLTDQGAAVQELLNRGWTAEQVRHVITSRPLPEPLHRTVGAIIAARLCAAQATTAPHRAAAEPAPDSQTSPDDAAGCTVSAALNHRVHVECCGCGSPSRAPGQDLCPACLKWPVCTACTGPTPRRANPAGDGRCTLCAT
ncbi:hypothetical protein ACWGII_18600 [Streptomyces sp. NPDC054855]